MVDITLEFIGRQIERITDELRATRRDMAEMSRSLLLTLERVEQIRTDVSVGVKLEVGHAMRGFEDRLEQIENRLDKIETRLNQ